MSYQWQVHQNGHGEYVWVDDSSARQAQWAAERARKEARKANRINLIRMASQDSQLSPQAREDLERHIKAEADMAEYENKWKSGCALNALILALAIPALAVAGYVCFH